MDIEGTASIILNDEGFGEQHWLVIINLEIIFSLHDYLNLTCTSNQNATIRSGLHIHCLNVVSKGCSKTLQDQKSTKTLTAIFPIIFCIPRNSCPSQVNIEQSCYGSLPNHTSYIDGLQLSSICIIALVEETDECTSNLLSHCSK